MATWINPDPTFSRKGKLANAISYSLSRREGLTRFVDDGLSLDTTRFSALFVRSSSTEGACSLAATTGPSIISLA